MNTQAIAMRDAFLDRVCQSMQDDDKVFFVSADFGSPVLDRIRENFPARFINVGIAEQNLINISAGLAIEGFKVFAYAIAPFITMRCYEQIRVNLALLSEVRPMNVNLIGVGAGYSYVVSGPTHQCYEDITVMRALPNVAVYSPADHIAAAALLEPCLANLGPKYLRFDAQILPVIYYAVLPNLKMGFNIHITGSDICMLATGYMVHTALKVAARLQIIGLSIGVIDLFDISHFDADELAQVLASYKGLVTLEEGFKARGGVDAMMFNFIAQRRMHLRMLNLGVHGQYRFELGDRLDLHEKAGIGESYVAKEIEKFAKLN